MIFLDSQASTPEAPEVIEAIARASRDLYGNPHSEHAFGRKAACAVEEARESLGSLIGCDPDEIVFTSGASESNNIAIQGTALARASRPIHFVTTTIEHKCVRATCHALEDRGIKVDYCPVGNDGRLSEHEFTSLLQSTTDLVSVMLVNNEIGVIQDLMRVSNLILSPETVFHSDIAQAVSKIPVDVKEIGLHMASFSAHKMHGPKGIGALYVGKDTPTRPIPVYYGGGQELGLRPGTLPVPLCVGFGVAAELAKNSIEHELQTMTTLRDRFLFRLRQKLSDFKVIGSMEQRVPHNLNIRFPGVSSDRLVGALQPNVAVSAGSACASGEIQPSYVLRAIGLEPIEALECIRIGFNRYLEESKVMEAADLIAERVLHIRDN